MSRGWDSNGEKMTVVNLVIDLETRSAVDIKKHGLDRYARSAEVLMMAWAFGDQPPQIWEPRFGPMPEQVAVCLDKPGIVKVAHNVAFERTILRYALGIDSPVEQWTDTAVLARYCALPSHLAEVCEALNLGDLGKNPDGSRLIRKFSLPQKKDGKFKDWDTDPEDWALFVNYCKQDVAAEREVLKRLAPIGFPERERRIFALDAKINERGLPVDMTFVANATAMAKTERAKLLQELKDITKVENPNSGKQMLGWLREQGYPYSSLNKKMVDRFLEVA